MNYYSKVKNFTCYLVKVETIAEELTQDVFCKIWENRDHLLNLRSFNQYIYRMAKNAQH
ncbi:MAG: sigma factor [Dysgonomonas sp.]